MEKKNKKVSPNAGESMEEYAERLIVAAGDRPALRRWYLNGENTAFEKDALTMAIIMSRSRYPVETKSRPKSKRGRK